MKKLSYLDYYILIPYLVLTSVGILMVYSASSFIALKSFDNAQYYFIRQAVFAGVGLFLCFFVYMLRLEILKYKAFVISAISIIVIMLLSLLAVGKEINGAKGWLDLGPLGRIQPAEFAKVVVIWYFAYIFSRRQQRFVQDLRETVNAFLAPLLLFVVGIVFPIILQPDIGGAIIILAIGVVMVLTSGISYKFGFGLGIVGSAVIFGVIELIRKFGTSLPFIEDYQYDRFLAFWDPFAVSESTGLQLVNSYYALNRGGLFGVGIGESVQKTGYLPEPYTDFIMSILGEELGLVGVLAVVLLFGFLILRIYLIGIKTKDSFGSLLCIGIATMLLIQSTINLGGVLGLMPITGVTFPFISYGGSSILILSASMGVALNVSATSKRRELRAKSTQSNSKK
ncbi:FtsW/RodA/SpoVE family cell cycle protein [Desemzia sp. RIT804]|uniref:FtsW/RodA/SpoVE family cell cycle protein n=1 Tax=Desemzia sp. RIT 804 TaxID=2810209 RepID=UPI001951BF1C|nr:FtsW/RodA/SpoVE family cell cycle protein [Desemzia sp. RIT 804]MBM6613614.1 FtsW/RodA/SpoVE family cell cycle protein [Desemzia sp. RIT 804]